MGTGATGDEAAEIPGSAPKIAKAISKGTATASRNVFKCVLTNDDEAPRTSPALRPLERFLRCEEATAAVATIDCFFMLARECVCLFKSGRKWKESGHEMLESKSSQMSHRNLLLARKVRASNSKKKTKNKQPSTQNSQIKVTRQL